jgi:hypothetical protein
MRQTVRQPKHEMTLRLPTGLEAALKEVSEISGLSKAEIIRGALRPHLNRYLRKHNAPSVSTPAPDFSEAPTNAAQG